MKKRKNFNRRFITNTPSRQNVGKIPKSLKRLYKPYGGLVSAGVPPA